MYEHDGAAAREDQSRCAVEIVQLSGNIFHRGTFCAALRPKVNMNSLEKRKIL
jgi:hypothetical protein